jgi:putative nucleotidyltransferase with HDIG domain
MSVLEIGGLPIDSAREIRLSEVIAALSYALDITEGQPEGHAVRSCLIGMRLAEEIGLDARSRSALFYALLLKDVGCSSNAAKVCALFGADDRAVKANLKTTDWSRRPHALRYIARNVAPKGSWVERIWRILSVGLQGAGSTRRLVETRCDRGASIARQLDFPDETAEAIRCLDEHWDGRGQPAGLRGTQIPLLARIAGLAQTVEVFFTSEGPNGAYRMARERRGRWFDPDLVDALGMFRNDTAFWERLAQSNVQHAISAAEPEEDAMTADDTRLDRVAEAFAKVIDAKSPWTYRHSEGVAETAVGIARILGYSDEQLRDLRRAGLLHDIGKLGISNMILDKPANLTDEERAEVRRHPEYTRSILERMPCFRHLADIASNHHERLDGRGYPRNLTAEQLCTSSRILCAADIYDALAADRPYRDHLLPEKVFEILRREVGNGICPQVFEALETYAAEREADPAERRTLSALEVAPAT